jgi:3-oxoacyl-(acyl-carrier-protein) synthase
MGSRSGGQHGAFFDETYMTTFDNELFGISEEEAWTMDVNQKNVCEVEYEALVKFGWTKASLKNKAISFFLGDIGQDWNSGLLQHMGATYDQSLSVTSCHNAVVPGRLSYLLGMTGPCMSIDTFCSSSLVATHEVHAGMRQNAEMGIPSDGALSGGVNILGLTGFIGGSGTVETMLGRCFTFDRTADGYLRGEGCNIMYFRMSTNRQDTADRFAVLSGSATNHDGRSASLTAPNGRSQQEVIRHSWRMADIDCEDVTAMELHGTGTALGDPIEVGAIANIMEDHEDPMPHTSAKSNIAHGEPNAGSIGLMKAILILHAMSGPPNVHLKSINAHLEGGAFPQLFEIESVDLRVNSGYCGVSSFGFGGANARGDVYMKAVSGPRARTTPDLSKIDYITVQCPKCLGRMCWRCGQAVNTEAPHLKHYCSLIRDEVAAYDYCTNCYTGGFRYGTPLRMNTILDDVDKQIFITGTWDAWSEMVEMRQLDSEDSSSPLVWACAVTLGDTRCEHFQLSFNKSKFMLFYPSEKNCGPSATVCGPDDNSKGRKWLINGLKDKAPAGTIYVITFEWGDKMSVRWRKVEKEEATPELLVSTAYKHTYDVCAGWCDGGFWEGRKQMAPIASEEGSYEATFPMSSKKLSFNLMRDRDPEQLIYPATPDTTDTWVPIRGPDDRGLLNKWIVRGRKGDAVKFKFHFANGQMSLTLSSESLPPVHWVGASEDEFPLYYIVGSFTDWEPRPMLPDDYIPGVHKYRFALDTSAYYGSSEPTEWIGKEEFHISIDGEDTRKLYPDFPLATVGQAVMQGPDEDDKGNNWLITGRMFMTVEVLLDFRHEDRRYMVSWQEVPADVLATLSRGVRSRILTLKEVCEAQSIIRERAMQEDIQKKFDEYEKQCGGDRHKFKAKVQKLLLQTAYTDIAERFGYANATEAGIWFMGSLSANSCREQCVEGVKTGIAIRDWDLTEDNKRFVEWGLSPAGPHNTPGADESWKTLAASGRFYGLDNPEERRKDPEDGVLRTFEEVAKRYIGQYTFHKLMSYWGDNCSRTVVAVTRDFPLPEAATEYLVLQRNLVKKLGADPSGTAMVLIKREVGCTIFTTGRVWLGKQGSEWVELDPLVEKPGWLLVEGRGFGPPGPLLQLLKPGEPQPLVLEVEIPTAPSEEEISEVDNEKLRAQRTFRKIVVRNDSKVRDAKEWIALIFGIQPSLIIVGAPGANLKPFGGDAFNVSLLDDTTQMDKAGFKDGDTVPYCYIGDAKKGFEGKVPTWEGKLGVAPKKKAAPPSASSGAKTPVADVPVTVKDRSQLSAHFETLGLDLETPPDSIKRQYRQLALSHHPDKHPDDMDRATAKFQAIKAAYEAIRDDLCL